MVSKDFESRLEKLEAIIRARPAPGAYLKMENGRVVVWINHKCVEARTYPSVFEAGQHVESLVNTLDNLAGEIWVNNICDLCPRPHIEKLKAAVNEVLGDKAIENDNQLRPWIESDHRFRFWDSIINLKELGGEPFNIALSGLRHVIYTNFDNCGFYMRYKNDEVTDEDDQMFAALLMVYLVIKPGDFEEQFSNYSQLFTQVVTLPDKQSEKE
jgi:hypothetical protein